MSTSSQASLQIGGVLSGAAAHALALAIEDYRCAEDWNGTRLDYDEAIDAIRYRAKQREKLFLCRDDSRFGGFDPVVAAARNYGLHYDRHFAATIYRNVPGTPEVSAPTDGDDEYEPMLAIKEVIELLADPAKGTAFVKANAPWAQPLPPLALTPDFDAELAEARRLAISA